MALPSDAGAPGITREEAAAALDRAERESHELEHLKQRHLAFAQAARRAHELEQERRLVVT